MGRNIYLSSIDLEEAKRKIKETLESINFNLDFEKVKTEDSLGLVSSKPVFASVSSPFYNSSAMDGICVITKENSGIHERSPRVLFKGTDFLYVDTGDPIPNPFDAVIMIEDVDVIDDQRIKIFSSPSMWQHIRPVGEDIVEKELIIPSCHKIRSMDIGALISGGVNEVEVLSKPKVSIIPTGTEIIEDVSKLEVGKIIDSNSKMFSSFISKCNGKVICYAPITDDYDKIKEAIIKASYESDLVIINAGTSAGSEDYTAPILKEIGKIIFHGVSIKPGKPVIFGVVNNTPIIGVPGYPVSAYIVLREFVKQILNYFNNQKETKYSVVKAVLSKKIYSSLKHLEFVRVKLGNVNDKLIATPLNRGAGVTMSLVNAHGFLKIPKNIEGIEACEIVDIELIKPIEEVENTIVSIGSHDLTVDILNNILYSSKEKYSLSSSHVGSMGGIFSMLKEECHIAPIHLLDEQSGEYNISYIHRYFNKKMVLIKGVLREQGLLVKKGNPKNIKGIADLINDDIIYVNRQKGSGTRVLLDYLLKEASIKSGNITGYNIEMITHMMVGAAINEGNADAGLGIRSVAEVLDLDFIPIASEEYDFLTEEKYLRDERIKKFIDVLKSQEFINELKKVGGYKVQDVGSIIRVDCIKC